MRTPSSRSVSRSLAVTVGLTVVALMVGLLVQVTTGWTGRVRQASHKTAPKNARANAQARSGDALAGDTTFSVTGGPFGPASQEISVASAHAMIDRCVVCPQLPPQGPMSVANVSKAWTAAEREVLLRYWDGVDLYMNPGSNVDSQEWIASWTTDISAGGWPGRMIDLRGTRAAAADKSLSWSAVIAWVEGAHLIELYGKGGQSLDELIQRAESFL